MNTQNEQDNNENYVEDDADEVFNRNEKKAKRSKAVRTVILVVAALVFCFSAVMLIRIFLEYKKGNDIYSTIQNKVLNEEPVDIVTDNSESIEVPFKYDHDALLAINPEGVGYFYLPSVNARYPIVQSTDNDFYLTHTFDKTYNKNGCLFVDYRINDGLESSNVIIYGHNMNNGSMFGQLKKYKSYTFWQTEGNDVFYLYTKDKIREYKIFSAYVSEPVSDTYTFNFSSMKLLRDYAQARKTESLYDTAVDVSDATQIVTLSTCTDNGQNRFIVHGLFVGESTLKD